MATARRKEQNTQEMHVGQDHPRKLSTSGDAELDPPLIEVVPGPSFKDAAEQAAFMEEKVKVMVHPTTEKNAPPFVEIWNNGRVQRFLRGRPQVVKRKFVEVMARAKETSYTQEEYLDGNGARAIRYIPGTAMRYPFSVLEDLNPKGAAWLAQILAQY